MAQPTHRITISRKDNKDITFKDYKGVEVTKKYCPIGVLFASDKIPGSFSFKLERKVTLDPELVWVNVYPNEPRNDNDSGEERKAPSARRRPPTAPKADDMFEDAGLPD